MRLARIAEEEKMKRMLVGLLLLGMVVSGVACGSSDGSPSGQSESAKVAAYNTVHDELLNAIAAYASENQGNIPELTGTYSIPGCTDCHIVDVNALLTSHGGILAFVPDGLYAASGGSNDNCDGGVYGCSSNNHYVWIMDNFGNVYSQCMGSDCNSNDASGYQGIWP